MTRQQARGRPSTMPLDLFGQERRRVELAPGAALLGGFALDRANGLLAELPALARVSPFRHLETRGGGRMSVAMTNCGPLGWVSDRSGYRYDAVDPLTGAAWPALPAVFAKLAAEAADVMGYR